MPIIYRLSTNSTASDTDDSDAENRPPPAPTDADDSIVLSDLVRTGEASRLRRRGAMRLEHPHQPMPPPQQPITPTVIVVGSPTWESDSEGPTSGPVFSRVRNGRTQRSRRGAGDDELDFGYTLFCGGEETNQDEGVDGRVSSPYVPSPLPLYPLSTPRRTPFSQRRKKTNGCGAVIHMSAAPRQRQGTWLARDDASAAVVFLESCYFDKDTASKIVRSACGCVREGIGCSVCGNPLGTRYKGCKSSSPSDATSATRRRPNMPFHPDGPRYWRAQNRHHKGGNTYTYNFFSSAVSSSPSYTFPQPPSPDPILEPYPSMLSAGPPDSYDTDTRYTNSIFDRLITASPAPLSDLGEEEEERESMYRDGAGFLDVDQGIRYGTGTMYDPDGEYISDEEPNSPDKTNDMMLFPER